MDPMASPAPPSSPQAPVDLSVLERIEGELDAVARALEQIDQGVYDGFAGLDEPAVDGASAPAGEEPPAPAPAPASG